MEIDIQLRLKKEWRLSGRQRAITIADPPNRRKTPSGTLTDPPEELWGSASGYASGDINVAELGDWLSGCLGQPILNVVRDLYPVTGSDDMRIMVSAAPDLQLDLMKTPWELIESCDSAQGLPLVEHCAVVRVLTDNRPPQPAPAGDRLRIAVLWANPRGDIPNLSDHLSELGEFLDNHPSIFAKIAVVEFTDSQKVLGPKGSPSKLDVEAFTGLLQQLGPPRLLLLNACAAAVGYQLNPYLGAALRLVREIEAVVAMQTMVPVYAALPFAREFLRGVGEGCGLASSLKRGRRKIMRHDPPTRGRRSFVPFIPVLFQRTVQDRLFSVDPTERELRQVLLALKQHVDRVEPYLERTSDPVLLKLLQARESANSVSFVYGPKGSGKSTSLRRAIRSLTTEEQFHAGKRWLYYDVRAAKRTAGVDATHIHNLLITFANALPVTASLHRQLSRLRNPAEAMSVFANWIIDEERFGRITCVCLDNLDVELAGALASEASNVLSGAGSLFLVAETHSLGPGTSANFVPMSLMSRDEIRSALQKHSLPGDDAAIEEALTFSNGLPYFVAGYILKPDGSGKVKDLAANLIASYRPGPSAEQRRILEFTALCGVSVPAQLLEMIYSPPDVRALVRDYPFLRETEAKTYLVPEGLREHLRDTAENRIDLHRTAFVEFHNLAATQDAISEKAVSQQVTAWYREAFEHGCSIVEQLADDSDEIETILDETRRVGEILHDRYFDGNEVEASRSLWQRFREVEQSRFIYDDRSADTHYAQCLMGAARLEEADELLEQAAEGGYVDRTQVHALFLRSNLIKAMGRKSDHSLRLDLLREALETARQLEEQSEEKEWAKPQVAALEHSLGNALAYGKEADPPRALEHLLRAQKIFEEVEDFGPAYFRTISEQIEVKRYNGLLSSGERQEAIQTLTENVRRLVAQEMKFDAIMHCYELGRLNEDPGESAKWFGEAFRRAGDNFEPVKWHAAIHSCIARVKQEAETFSNIAPQLQEYADKLLPWQTWAWSRRVRRDALLFLAESYDRLGQAEQALSAARSAWEIALAILELGEGRKDARQRLEIALIYGRLSAHLGHIEQGRAVALALASELALTTDSIVALNQIQLEELFRAKKRERENT